MGDHLRQGGPSMATKSAMDGPAGPVVAGDHMRRDRPDPISSWARFHHINAIDALKGDCRMEEKLRTYK